VERSNLALESASINLGHRGLVRYRPARSSTILSFVHRWRGARTAKLDHLVHTLYDTKSYGSGRYRRVGGNTRVVVSRRKSIAADHTE
jgi:hypothetical protein